MQHGRDERDMVAMCVTFPWDHLNIIDFREKTDRRSAHPTTLEKYSADGYLLGEFGRRGVLGHGDLLPPYLLTV